MKSILLLLAFIIVGYAGQAQKGKLTKGERDFIVKYLTETQEILLQTVAEAEGDLWTYKPTPESWSVADCFEHILIAEGGLSSKVMDKLIVGESNVDEELSSLDGIVIANVTDRSKKVKTLEPFEPSGRWTTKQEMIDELNRSRAALIEFAQTTKADLRSFKANTPVGERDAYQHLLIIGAHGFRHTMQMKEAMAHSKATASSN